MIKACFVVIIFPAAVIPGVGAVGLALLDPPYGDYVILPCGGRSVCGRFP
jgi:hypothetical protein